MNALWSPEGLEALRAFALADTLIAFDYDGTLAAITDDPDQATMRTITADLLGQVARRFATVVLTGRGRHDALRLLADVPNIEVIGNHGAESSRDAPNAPEHIGIWKAELKVALKHLSGVVIEDKWHSLSVHFRAAPDVEAAETEIWRAAFRLPGVRLVGGKCVLNLVERDSPNKATALLAEMQRQDCPRSLFVGDDVTDEDVFALKLPERLLTVRVGPSVHSDAQYFLPDQHGVDELLRFLAHA